MAARLDREADDHFASLDSEDLNLMDPEIARIGAILVVKRAVAAELRTIIKETECHKKQ